ncbi:solute carrier family 15 member 2 isoform X1 [Anguilla anguilla]|uniref:solute carrier family 15 member 2 isoform X1 n=1 Tax=Anguilla anguilla TaxID=7936 RepID=UPI0015AB05BF|nr:solute carrier family 15 member 2 isoform X1 [Anguilla anguilla]
MTMKITNLLNAEGRQWRKNLQNGRYRGKVVENPEGATSKRSPTLCGTNYPLSISFIVVNEFCERFSYYGMKALLTLYFMRYLHWDKDLSTAVYHAFSSLCYFTPVLGALIADSWLGKFRTIIYLSIVYVIGHVVKSVGAIPDVGDTTTHIVLSILGLVLIAFGTGGIKPCVAAFGGDQFTEEHAEERTKFFSIFYMSINAGSVLSTVITPILRGDVQCFGGDCYALAFGVPALLMIIALVVFIAGSGLYKKNPPEGNILLKVCQCIGYAIKNRWRNRKKSHKRAHWLDWADDKYSKRLIHEIQMVLRVLVLYIPLPMFWALFDQQGSRWTLQATRMNMDFGGFILKPDQMQMLNALLILVFIPIFDIGVYPLVRLCGIKLTPLRKMASGMILAALAFVAATVVEMGVTNTVVDPPLAGQSLLKVLNLAATDVQVTVPGSVPFPHPIRPYEATQEYQRLELNGVNQSLAVTVEIAGSSTPCPLVFTEQTAYSLILYREAAGLQCRLVEDQIVKSEHGDAYLRFVNAYQEHLNLTVGDQDFYAPKGHGVTPHEVVARGEYTDVMCKAGQEEHPVNLGLLDFGASYTIVLKGVNDSAPGPEGRVVPHKMEDVRANNVHIAWQIPQYTLITAGEVMFSITGLEFSYSQAPASMKSVLQAGWLMTVAFGNVIVLIVAEGAGLEQWVEFLLFASLLVAVSIIFSIMAQFYTYVDGDQLDSMFPTGDEEEDNLKKDQINLSPNPGTDRDYKATKM